MMGHYESDQRTGFRTLWSIFSIRTEFSGGTGTPYGNFTMAFDEE